MADKGQTTVGIGIKTLAKNLAHDPDTHNRNQFVVSLSAPPSEPSP